MMTGMEFEGWRACGVCQGAARRMLSPSPSLSISPCPSLCVCVCISLSLSRHVRIRRSGSFHDMAFSLDCFIVFSLLFAVSFTPFPQPARGKARCWHRACVYLLLLPSEAAVSDVPWSATISVGVPSYVDMYTLLPHFGVRDRYAHTSTLL